MAPLVVVHTEPLLEEFRAPFCSAANFWRFLSIFFSISLSLLLCFASQGLWRRSNTFLEKPNVQFNEHTLFTFESLSQNEKKIFFWSPMAKVNENATDQFELLVPIIETIHNDWDGDWRADEIEIRVAFRHKTNSNSSPSFSLNFTAFSYALFFDVKLEKRTLVELKGTPIFGKIQSKNPFNEIHIIGSVDFVQRNFLPAFGNLTFAQWSAQFSADGFPSKSSPEEIDWQMRKWSMEQNFSIVLGRKIERVRMTTHQRLGGGILCQFVFHIRISEQTLQYRTNAWEMVKWAWVQYLALFVVVRYLVNTLSSFLYQNQIIGTFVAGPKDKIH
ncbi:hypothetical protein niasHS_003691 [Heterodera schachtii]|uniref:Transmembrane protein 231 n=1 Tax=Heterodera schachtii TaxID=97005 RepID=A0ABD2KHK3_HETSC